MGVEVPNLRRTKICLVRRQKPVSEPICCVEASKVLELQGFLQFKQIRTTANKVAIYYINNQDKLKHDMWMWVKTPVMPLCLKIGLLTHFQL